MDEAGRAALGCHGEQLAAEHLIEAGMTVPACRWPADHRSVSTAGVRLDVVSSVRQRGEASRLEHLPGAS